MRLTREEIDRIEASMLDTGMFTREEATRLIEHARATLEPETPSFDKAYEEKLASIAISLNQVSCSLFDQSKNPTPSVLVLRSFAEQTGKLAFDLIHLKPNTPSFEVAEKVVKERMLLELANLSKRADADLSCIELDAMYWSDGPKVIWAARANLLENDRLKCQTLDEALAAVPRILSAAEKRAKELADQERIKAEAESKIALLKAEMIFEVPERPNPNIAIATDIVMAAASK